MKRQGLNKLLFERPVGAVTRACFVDVRTLDLNALQGTRAAALAVVPSENAAVSVRVAPDTNSMPA